jgi:hypothetical protein
MTAAATPVDVHDRGVTELAAAGAHAAVADEVLKALGAGDSGLTSVETTRRLAEFGPNRLPDPRGPACWFACCATSTSWC